MIKLDMEDPGICDNCIFCRENSNTGASECILKLPNHYEVDIHSKDENCPIIAVAKGEWIFDSEHTEFGNPYGTYKCNKCGGHSADEYSFCKDCGADMRRGGTE